MPIINLGVNHPSWIYEVIREISEGENELVLYRKQRRFKGLNSQYCKKEKYI